MVFHYSLCSYYVDSNREHVCCKSNSITVMILLMIRYMWKLNMALAATDGFLWEIHYRLGVWKSFDCFT